MLSREDLNSAEFETVRVSKNPTTVVIANGDVQNKRRSDNVVKELDLFVTVKLLEDTRAVLSLGKLCEDQGYFLTLDQWSEATSHQKRHTMQHGELRKSCSVFIGVS